MILCAFCRFLKHDKAGPGQVAAKYIINGHSVCEEHADAAAGGGTHWQILKSLRER